MRGNLVVSAQGVDLVLSVQVVFVFGLSHCLRKALSSRDLVISA